MNLGSLIEPFIGPVSSATFAFPAAASLLVVPFALYHYRKHGRVHPWRAFLSYSFVYYMIAALFLVILPLPDRPAGEAETAAWTEAYADLGTPRLDPTGFVRDVIAAPDAAERSLALAQIAFNILLLVPFGVYLAYAFRRPLYVVPIFGLLLSLFYEICQLTGDFGWYPSPYRLFDAGDIVLNTAGALAGALLARLLAKIGLLPKLDSLPGPTDPWIGPFRRLLANFLDACVVLVLALGLTILVDIFPPSGAVAKAAIASTLLLGVFVALPAVDRGRGIGRRLTFSAIRKADGKPARAVNILARQAALWAMPAAAYLAVSIEPRLGSSLPAVAVFLAWLVLFVLNALKTTFDNEHAGYLDRWLTTRVRDTWTEEHAPRKRAKRKAPRATGGKRSGPKP